MSPSFWFDFALPSVSVRIGINGIVPRWKYQHVARKVIGKPPKRDGLLVYLDSGDQGEVDSSQNAFIS